MNKPLSSHQRFPYLALFFCYFVAWVVANWPALHQVWWTSDDYTTMLRYDFQHNLVLGRPIEGIHQWFLQFEQYPRGAALNIFFRYWQGILHCATALLAIKLLYQYTDRAYLLLTGLLFVVWPFQGEAVLWRVSALPLAAFLAMAGLFLVLNGVQKNRWWRYLLGSFLIALATVTHQLTAMIAGFIWCYLLLLRVISSSQTTDTPIRTLGRELVGISIGYLGGITTALILIHRATQSFFRASPPVDWPQKGIYWLELLQKFFFIKYLPLYAQILQLFILALIGCTLLYLFIQRPKHSLILMVGLALLLILPYAPMLLVAENPTSPRIQYLAPFIFILGFLLIDQSFQGRYDLQWPIVALTTVMLIIYIPISQDNVVDFVHLFEADRQTLHQIEAEIQTLNGQAAPLVTVAIGPNYTGLRASRPMNYPWGDAKRSVYVVPWSVNPFIEHFSRLQPVDDPMINTQCTDLCNKTADGQPFLVSPLPDSTICCICP